LCELSRDQVVGQPVVGVAAASKLVNSKGDAKRLADTGGLYVNNKPVSGVSAVIQESDLIDSKVVLLRSGKKNYKLVMLTQ
jgi:tyrosyl-tRNA synthetase